MAATVAEMEHVEAYAVASRDKQKARDFAQTYKIRKAYGSYEEMLNDPEVDLVYVCTPHSLHYEHMMLALKSGKHVLCEKSFTTNADQARKRKSFWWPRRSGHGICRCAWSLTRFSNEGSSVNRTP
jgi:predicted dehydrogenase